MKYREYFEPSGRPELGEESSLDFLVLSNHIMRWWGYAPEVIHEIVSEYVHVDLSIVPASEDRPYHSVVTTEMSDRPMHTPEGAEGLQYCELAMALPPGWPTRMEDLCDERHWWPFRELIHTAKFPHMYNTWIWGGHLISDGNPPKPFADNVGFCAAILSDPVLCPREGWSLKIREDKEVHFFAFVPIYEAELRYACEKGPEALLEKLDDIHFSGFIQPGRRCVV
jgi:hypothetical protein